MPLRFETLGDYLYARGSVEYKIKTLGERFYVIAGLHIQMFFDTQDEALKWANNYEKDLTEVV